MPARSESGSGLNQTAPPSARVGYGHHEGGRAAFADAGVGGSGSVTVSATSTIPLTDLGVEVKSDGCFQRLRPGLWRARRPEQQEPQEREQQEPQEPQEPRHEVPLAAPSTGDVARPATPGVGPRT